tara:strand:- start:184 stop:348 length:165 start_codon:yes stop_codon:yes gene_type:complete
MLQANPICIAFVLIAKPNLPFIFRFSHKIFAALQDFLCPAVDFAGGGGGGGGLS